MRRRTDEVVVCEEGLVPTSCVDMFVGVCMCVGITILL